MIELRNLNPKPFYRDPVYEIELHTSPRDLPCYMVIFPKTDSAGAVTEIPVKSTWETTRETIPELFSEEPCPGWVREFYRRTGIDLTLLTFVNSLNLYVNPEHIADDIHLDFIPVSAGTHTIQLTGNRLFPGSPVGSGAILLCRIHSTKGIREIKYPLTPPFPSLSIQTTEPVSFMDITVSGIRNSNLLIERITMVPDYRTFVESRWRPTFFK
jgi:hypothetical protein